MEGREHPYKDSADRPHSMFIFECLHLSTLPSFLTLSGSHYFNIETERYTLSVECNQACAALARDASLLINVASRAKSNKVEDNHARE